MDDLPFEYRRRPLSMAPLLDYTPTRARRTWLGLQPYPEGGPLAWRGSPDLHFKPEGVMLLDGPERALLHAWIQRKRKLLPASSTPVRLALFERFEDRSDDHDEARPQFLPVDPGDFVTLDVSDSDGNPIPRHASLTLWGITIEKLY